MDSVTIDHARATSGLESVDADVLLAALFQKDRAWLLIHGNDVLTADQQKQWADWTNRRRGHEPVSYITGEKEFYGRTFHVDNRVLIPRPATERLVDIALEQLKHPTDSVTEIDSDIVAWTKTQHNEKVTTVVDVGTGSGCIAITIACEQPDVRVIATDISEDALEVAQANAIRLGVDDRITWRHGPHLDPLKDITEPFLLVSNPPYIRAGKKLMEDVEQFEPHTALFAGEDGRDVVRTIVEQAQSHPYCMGWVMECETDQATEDI